MEKKLKNEFHTSASIGSFPTDGFQHGKLTGKEMFLKSSPLY